MKFLEKYYDDRVENLEETEFLKQVGHTEGGHAISDAQFDSMVSGLASLLTIHPKDTFLDLCCGNGVITQKFATSAEYAAGIELSKNMIDVARKYHSDSVQYFHKDVLKLSEIEELQNVSFSKILMHGALQHFTAEQFEQLLSVILAKASARCVIVFGFIPEDGKQRYFYDTPSKKITSFFYRQRGKDVLGTWWNTKTISETCDKLSLRCTFHPIHPSLLASKYQCDIRIERQAT